ncbi:MAG TPA: hypothetical protein VMU18_12945 [Rhodoblastus sp.]|nr:hypothetical protein [Rhodoblastus sp.]
MSADRTPETVGDLKKTETMLTSSVVEALQGAQKAFSDLAALLEVDSSAALDALREASHAASDKVAGFAGDARDMSRVKLDDLSAAVRKNPLLWLAGAVGLGLVVGLWRNRDSR